MQRPSLQSCPDRPERQDRLIEAHLRRVETAVFKRHTAATMASWVTQETQLGGLPYSFKHHEYQERILSDASRDLVVRKCSQVGLSEASARMALATVNILTPFTIAYTLPTAKFAGTFAKTRIDPIIAGSRVLQENIHRTNDNNEVKQFGESLMSLLSFLYWRGANSATACSAAYWSTWLIQSIQPNPSGSHKNHFTQRRLRAIRLHSEVSPPKVWRHFTPRVLPDLGWP